MKLYRFCFLFRAYISFSSFGLVQEGGTLVKFDGQSGRRRNPIRCNPEGTLGREARKFIRSYCRGLLDILRPLVFPLAPYLLYLDLF